jgi:hypothetical protein
LRSLKCNATVVLFYLLHKIVPNSELPHCTTYACTNWVFNKRLSVSSVLSNIFLKINAMLLLHKPITLIGVMWCNYIMSRISIIHSIPTIPTWFGIMQTEIIDWRYTVQIAISLNIHVPIGYSIKVWVCLRFSPASIWKYQRCTRKP